MEITTEFNVNLYKITDFSSIVVCRFCGVTCVKKKYMFLKNNIELLDKIKDSLQIEIDFNTPECELLPRQICETCLDTIDCYLLFKNRCLAIDYQWNQIIKGGFFENESDISLNENDDPNSQNKITDVAEATSSSIPCEDDYMIADSSTSNIDEIKEGEIEWIEYEDWTENNEVVSNIKNSVENEEYLENEVEENKELKEQIALEQTETNLNDPEQNTSQNNTDTSIVERKTRNGYLYQTTAHNYITEDIYGHFICNFCMTSFRWRFQCEVHVRGHTKETPFKCNRCDKAYAAKCYLNAHVTQMHKKQLFCKVCNKQFSRKYLLNEHEWEHTGEPRIKCNHCDMKFYGTTKLTAHVRNCHSERSHVCDICGKAFKTKIRFNDHRTRHFGDKKYDCSLCVKKFVTKRELHLHLKKHSRNLPFKCIECNMSFKSKKGLIFHVRLCQTETTNEEGKDN